MLETLFRNTKLQIKSEVQEMLVTSSELGDEEVFHIIDKIIKKKSHEIYLNIEDKRRLRTEVFYSIRGLDVLSELLQDDEITEIMVNGVDKIFIEKSGRITLSNKAFDSPETLTDIIQKIVSEANRTVNMSSPIVDARLKDGSRVNVVLEPISIDGPVITIRRFPNNPLTMDKLVSLNAVSDEIVTFLKILVESKHNILISGGTGSGKTTFLNALSKFIPKDERIITIEDSAELKIQGINNIIRLETRNTNAEGVVEITIRDLIKTALRMRPDRIIVGEVRGEEAIDMLQAFGVGQDGSLSTIHANSAEDALIRLETLIMLNSENIPLRALRRQIVSGVDIIIQLSRLNDASRKLMEIVEVVEMNGELIRINPLFEYSKGKFMKINSMINTHKLQKAGINELSDI